VFGVFVAQVTGSFVLAGSLLFKSELGAYASSSQYRLSSSPA
jgi:hypothetical protein